MLLEPDNTLAVEHGVEVVDSVVSTIEENGHAKVMLANQLGFPHWLEAGVELGTVRQVEVVDSKRVEEEQPGADDVAEKGVVEEQRQVEGAGDNSETGLRRRQVLEAVVRDDLEQSPLTEVEKQQLTSLVLDQHEAFCLEDGERGETDMVMMSIKTGDAKPKRQQARRIPFALR